MTDIVFISIPKLQTKGPILSITQLKACVKEAGFTSTCYDFNIWLYNKTKDTELGYIWKVLDNTLITEKIKDIEDEYRMYWNEFFEENIKKDNPKIIGITAFSSWTYPNIDIITKEIKKTNPEIKILIGGPAVRDAPPDKSSYGLDNNADYFKNLKDGGLIDDFICGDAEISIVEYLKGNKKYPGINSFNPIEIINQDAVPIPDYEDIDMSVYTDPQYFIRGSRGCVRKCAFCNVPLIWKKFRFRTGERIADEIIYLYEKYNFDKVYLIDSLTNGNQKEFLKLLEYISLYKIESGAKFDIGGQFICREKKQIKPRMFSLMKSAGYNRPTIGIESGSEKVRKELGKYFSNESIEYHLQEMDRVGIKMVPLFFVGFPTETDEDFQETVNILDMFAKYPKVVKRIHMDHPMHVIEGTPVHLNPERYDIEHITNSYIWESKHSNYKKRIERFFIFLDEAIKRNLFDRPTVSDKSYTMINDYYQYDDLDDKVVNIMKGW
mgnify:CR=1 FL=1